MIIRDYPIFCHPSKKDFFLDVSFCFWQSMKFCWLYYCQKVMDYITYVLLYYFLS
jgi:hypothetical protein